MKSMPSRQQPKRIYNISEFPSHYRIKGGVDDSDRQLLGGIYSGVTSSFEYGLGESTYIAAWTRMPRWSGVDSDPDWIVGLRNKRLIPLHFQFHFGHVGMTGVRGYPRNRLDKSLFRYVVAPLALEREPFDVCLVDDGG